DDYLRSFVFEIPNNWVLRDYPGKDKTRVIRTADQFGEDKSDLRTASFTQFSFADTAVEVRITLLAL
ncbi:MAG: hypothetical protein H7Y08_07375, partial [Rhizobiaceae bacterium]|nr:hypothetical protein [Rhizobiaceae bacterium]